MSRIPLTTRGKRPNFFDNAGQDQTVSMILELMTELWVVKERQFRLEKVLEQHGINAAEELEANTLDEAAVEALESSRRQFVETILRTLNTEFVSPEKLQQEIDQLSDSQ